MESPRIPTATHDEVAELATTVMGSRPTRTLREVSDGLGLGYDATKRLAVQGVLPVVRVSPRRIAVTYAGLVRYLFHVNGLSPTPDNELQAVGS